MYNNIRLASEDGDILISNAIESVEVFLGDNWHLLERNGKLSTRWISDDASLKLDSKSSMALELSFKAASFYRPRHIQVYLNDHILIREKVPTSFIEIKVPLSLIPGSNILKFSSMDGCERPVDIPCLHNDDTRPLSFIFYSLNLGMAGAINFDYKNHPLKLNLGYGIERRDGYLNIDSQDSPVCDLIGDIRDLGMLPSDTYDEISAQNCLEHIHYNSVKPALREWYRLLRKGGVINIRTLDILGVLELFNKRQSLEEHLDLLRDLFNTRIHSGDFHQVGLTSLIMELYLKEIGFSNIQIASKDQWLLEATARK